MTLYIRPHLEPTEKRLQILGNSRDLLGFFIDFFVNFLFYFLGKLWFFSHFFFSRFSPLSKSEISVAKPGPFFLDHSEIYSHIDKRSAMGESFVEKDIEFRCLKRGSAFIFNHFDFYPRADFIGVITGFNPPDSSNI